MIFNQLIEFVFEQQKECNQSTNLNFLHKNVLFKKVQKHLNKKSCFKQKWDH